MLGARQWKCTSTAPGKTCSPVASISRCAGPTPPCGSTSAILPSRMPTSSGHELPSLVTVPLRMRRSSTWATAHPHRGIPARPRRVFVWDATRSRPRAGRVRRPRAGRCLRPQSSRSSPAGVPPRGSPQPPCLPASGSPPTTPRTIGPSNRRCRQSATIASAASSTASTSSPASAFSRCTGRSPRAAPISWANRLMCGRDARRRSPGPISVVGRTAQNSRSITRAYWRPTYSAASLAAPYTPYPSETSSSWSVPARDLVIHAGRRDE